MAKRQAIKKSIDDYVDGYHINHLAKHLQYLINEYYENQIVQHTSARPDLGVDWWTAEYLADNIEDIANKLLEECKNLREYANSGERRPLEDWQNAFNKSTKKSQMKKSTSDPLNDKIGQTIFFHGREYEITDIDMVGSDKNDKGEFGLLFDVYLMDARDTTYSVTILVPRGKEDEVYSSDEWTDYIFGRRGDVTVTHPEDWEAQSYYYQHYGIEPTISENARMDVNEIKEKCNVPEGAIQSIKQIADDHVQIVFDVSDWYYYHIPDDALDNAGYYTEWYDSWILDVYQDSGSMKSTKKSTQKPINKTMSFEDNVNKLRKSNYDRTGNINTIIKERR